MLRKCEGTETAQKSNTGSSPRRKHHFGREKCPHAERVSFALLLYRIELMARL